MSVSKTRQKLVDVARQLFAKNGLESTTMNDIATASGKGRRTLYTYFKSKEEIYYAVIEGELERLSDKLDEVAARKIRPQDKIIELIYTHLSMIRETVVRNGNLRAEFFRNIWMVEKVRRHFDDAEVELFRKVIHHRGYVPGKKTFHTDLWRDYDENVSVKRCSKIMKKMHITANRPKKDAYKHMATHDHECAAPANAVNQNFFIGPSKVILTDITYFWKIFVNIV